MNIIRAEVTIVGKRPFLFHSFSVDSIALKKREKTGVAGNDPEEWKRSVLYTNERQLYIPSSYIFGCIRDGGKHIKSGKGSIQAKIAATLVVVNENILLDRFLPAEDALTQNPNELVYLDVRSVKNPATKGRNVRYRVAASPGWHASFEFDFDVTVVSRHEMESALISAGSLAGLGDGRSIGMGRFEVTNFEIVELEEKKSKKKKSVIIR